jgi:hypothetical protein
MLRWATLHYSVAHQVIRNRSTASLLRRHRDCFTEIPYVDGYIGHHLILFT